MINKQFVLILMVVFSGMFSLISFMLSSLYALLEGKYLLYAITFLVTGIAAGIVLIVSLGDKIDPYASDKRKWHIVILSAFLVVLVFASHFWITLYTDGIDEWNDQCLKKGLSPKCTSSDECGADCNKLNKEFYKYEAGGLFKDSNCWCKKGESTEQIW